MTIHQILIPLAIGFLICACFTFSEKLKANGKPAASFFVGFSGIWLSFGIGLFLPDFEPDTIAMGVGIAAAAFIASLYPLKALFKLKA